MEKSCSECVACMKKWVSLDQTGLDFKIPVLFYLQLLDLAMGYSLEDMQYGSHRVTDQRLVEKINAIKGANPL